LGTLGIHKLNGVCNFILSYEGDIAEYSTFLQAFKIIHREKINLRKKKEGMNERSTPSF